LQEYAETASLLRDPQLENALRAMRQNCSRIFFFSIAIYLLFIPKTFLM
jgi:hypothetical protein